jgi:hypothetical protein
VAFLAKLQKKKKEVTAVRTPNLAVGLASASKVALQEYRERFSFSASHFSFRLIRQKHMLSEAIKPDDVKAAPSSKKLSLGFQRA